MQKRVRAAFIGWGAINSRVGAWTRRRRGLPYLRERIFWRHPRSLLR